MVTSTVARRTAGSLRPHERFPEMDGLRALAVTSVLALHVSYSVGVNPRNLYVLGLALPLFFGLSGFLLYRPFVVGKIVGSPESVGHYGFKRVMRIFPGYWVALTIGGIWTGLRGLFAPGVAPFHYLLIQIWQTHGAEHGLAVSWSLGVEITFYAALAALVVVRRRSNHQRSPAEVLAGERRLVGALAAFSFIWLAVLVLTRATTPQLGYALPTVGLTFAAGMWTALVEVGDRIGIPSRAVRSARNRSLGWWCVAAVVAAVVMLIDRQVWPHASTGSIDSTAVNYTLGALAVWLLLVPSAVCRAGGLGKRLGLTSRPGVWLARISYGVYLWHSILLQVLGRAHWQQNHGVVVFVVASVVGSLALGWLSWVVVERPAVRFAARYTGPREAWRALRRSVAGDVAPDAVLTGARSRD
jgi:peptidoglycan/LPS O-acetylase OafA/YrhL